MLGSKVTYSRRFWLLSALWFTVWSGIQTILLYYYKVPLKISIVDSLFSNFILILAVYVSNNMFRFYQPKTGDRAQRLIWGLALTFLSVYALKFILEYFFSNETDYLSFLHNSLPIRFVLFLLMIACMQIARWLIYLDKDEREKKERENQVAGIMKEAELSKLRLQLQPHFLFNSLNSINALVVSKPAEARKMVQQLSDFLRGTIKHEDHSLITLGEEIKYLQLYLEIEKVRFGDRLQTEITVPEHADALKVPALLLQPVVENAIKFGLYDTIDAVKIVIEAKVEQHSLIIEVSNPFDSETSNVNKGTGFGLSSIQKRLYLLYARKDLLQTIKQENIFKTIIKIPQ